MKKVVFINPPGPTKGIHNGIGLLSAVLTKAGIESFVIDMNNSNLDRQMIGEISRLEKADFALIKSEIDTRNPDFVCLPVLSVLASAVDEIIRFVKSEFPGKPVVVGGPHLSFEGEKFLEESGADFGILGEGEKSIVELVDGKKEPSEISGLLYKQLPDGKIARTGPREPEKDLDSLPFPNYDNFSSVIKNNGKIWDYPLTTSRGCPYRCIFCCSHIITGRKWRARSPENVVSELVRAKQKYGIKSVAILDDNFTLERGRALRICELIIENNLGLKMRCLSGVRADKLDMELLKKLKEAGFSYLSIGIESVNPSVFDAVKKGESLDAIKVSIENAKRIGLRINGFFVIGLPHSTYERDLESIRFAKSMGITCWWSMATPFPHTELWEWVNEHGRWLRDFRSAAPSGIDEVAFDTPDYPAEKRKEAFMKALVMSNNFYRLEEGYVKRFRACLKYYPPSVAGYHYWLVSRMAVATLRRIGLK